MLPNLLQPQCLSIKLGKPLQNPRLQRQRQQQQQQQQAPAATAATATATASPPTSMDQDPPKTSTQLTILGVGNDVEREVLMKIAQAFGSEALFASDMAGLGRALDLSIEYRMPEVAGDVADGFLNGTVSLASRLPDGYREAILGSPESALALTQVETFLRAELRAHRPFYPSFSRIFLALDSRPLNSIKVVMLGQEPYCSEGQAHGLAFSVGNGDLTGTIGNILREVQTDVGTTVATPTSGNLQSWAAQGVLLLNSILTTQRNVRWSHKSKGWERITNRIIEAVSEANSHVVFMLWGRTAQSKARFIDTGKHLVLEASNPCGFSAHQAAPRAFIGSKPFSKANAFLAHHKIGGINW